MNGLFIVGCAVLCIAAAQDYCAPGLCPPGATHIGCNANEVSNFSYPICWWGGGGRATCDPSRGFLQLLKENVKKNENCEQI
jgi:hypothetical protein